MCHCRSCAWVNEVIETRKGVILVLAQYMVPGYLCYYFIEVTQSWHYKARQRHLLGNITLQIKIKDDIVPCTCTLYLHGGSIEVLPKLNDATKFCIKT